ncbi:LAGLIDADG family homing endonuclease [Nanoarchaeota archaeon]
MSVVSIEKKYVNETINIALDTIARKKQALVFVNSKRSAEKTAEDIAQKIKVVMPEMEALAEDVLGALGRPTKQCERLARCVRKGTAFHHAGLTGKQRTIVEDAFRDGRIKIISCTPTLCLSGDSNIWHGISETKVSKFKISNPIFALSRNQIEVMKSQKIEKITNMLKLIQITSVSDYSIKVTPNHKMLVKRSSKKLLLPANKVRKTDKLATIGYLPVDKTSNPSIKSFVKNNFLPINVRFNPSLSYFIGCMLGDGYSGVEFDDGKVKYKGSPSIVGIDKEIFDNTIDVSKLLSLTCRKSKTVGGTPSLILGKNKWFREFLLRSGVEKKDRKCISEKLMMMDLENTSALLRGLFDTDGYAHKRGDVGFTNISRTLIKQMQKLLLRFGIVSRIRKRPAGSMKIFEKEYLTQPYYEILIAQKRSVVDFYKYVGFNVQRKQDALFDIVAKIFSNVKYVSCNNCSYKLHKDLFGGRTKKQKEWGKTKKEIIKLLGVHREIGSKVLKQYLGRVPRGKESRTNHHYEFIKKRRLGNRGATEWLWSLNKIGNWVYKNILSKDKSYLEVFKLRSCPICGEKLDWILKKGWRDSDFDGDIFWDSIRSIKEVKAEADVYDVVLPQSPKNDHLFVAGGFFVHNSAGVDLPAYRSVIRDLKRYSGAGWGGMQFIPVLEYLQMAGRAGRPNYDTVGEAICIASNSDEKEKIHEKYILGEPEEVYSKLAVEPVLRTYILSLIATDFVQTKSQILDFFSRTFWAFQFKDMAHLRGIIEKMLGLLERYEFISMKQKNDFVSADEVEAEDEKIRATFLGKRVAQLYVDPLTAHHLIKRIRRSTEKEIHSFGLLQMVTNTLEMRPLLKVKTKEYDEVIEQLNKYEHFIFQKEPSIYDQEYDDFLASVKTAFFLLNWVGEKDEEFLLEQFDVRPGETRVKIERADWLLYCCEELAKIMHFNDIVKEVIKIRFRLKYGVKEELLPLLRFKGIGRVRARKLFGNGIKDVGGVKKVDVMTLVQLLGKKLAVEVKKQVGQEVDLVVSERKRKGQMSLGKY